MKPSNLAAAAAIITVPIIGLQFVQNSRLKGEIGELTGAITELRENNHTRHTLSSIRAEKGASDEPNNLENRGAEGNDPPNLLQSGEEISAQLSAILAQRDPMQRMSSLLEFVSRLGDDAIPDALTKLRQNTPEWDPDARVAAQLMLTRWGKTDPDAALAYVSELDYRKAGGDAAIIISALASTDPQQAIKWLEDPDNKMVKQPWLGQILAGSITKEWVRQDPEAALAWAMTLPKNQQSGAYGGVLGTIAATDPERASTLANDLPEGDARRDVIGQIARAWSESSPGDAIRWASSLDGEERNRAMGEALGSWARSDPSEAAQFVDSLDQSDRSDGMLDRVASNWARQEPEEAAEWIGNQSESKDKANAMGDVMWNWTVADPQAASEWLLEQPAGDSRDEGIVALARVTFEEDPSSAVTWAAHLGDDQKRKRSVSVGINVWLDRDPEGANQWLNTTDTISQEEVQRLLTERNERKAKEAEAQR